MTEYAKMKMALALITSRGTVFEDEEDAYRVTGGRAYKGIAQVTGPVRKYLNNLKAMTEEELVKWARSFLDTNTEVEAHALANRILGQRMQAHLRKVEKLKPREYPKYLEGVHRTYRKVIKGRMEEKLQALSPVEKWNLFGDRTPCVENL